MQVLTKAACRVDLAGGTMDIWPLYLYHSNAVTVNFAINIYTACRVTVRPGKSITLRAIDQKIEETYDSIETLREAKSHRHPLAAWVLRYFCPEGGLLVETSSESPAGAGIAGSSSLLISTVSALNKLCGTKYGIENVRELAQNIEAQIIRVPTGCQDYYPAMYGGVSAIELTPAGIRRKAIPVDHDELNRRFVLAYTGKPRNSGINNWEVTKLHVDGDRTVLRNFDKIAAIAHAMRGALEKNDWAETSRLLREEWSFRKRNAPGITTPLIDRLVAATRKKGANAAKVCGAGGGGCIVFLCEPDAKRRVADAVRAEGAQVLEAQVAPQGVKIQVKN
jgi:D-glycero-alpha-D-manno-heptose-7-phosphate kinase